MTREVVCNSANFRAHEKKISTKFLTIFITHGRLSTLDILVHVENDLLLRLVFSTSV